jgi:hypothetical protein
MPATGAFMGTPASMSDRVLAHTLAIDVLPLLDRTSETRRMVYGNSSSPGMTGSIARSARAPWPTARRLGVPNRLTSPTENGGKL